MDTMRFPSLVLLLSIAAAPLYAAEEEIVFQGFPFHWVNPIPEDGEYPTGLQHATFLSSSMQKQVGYAIYLPPQYAENPDKRFPVVYYLHGGRPGSESRSIGLSRYLDAAMSRGETSPVIYVYVNGGILSHYNYAPLESMAEDLFINELIPLIDANYRTINDRSGRAIQGFSQGGRGTTRIMFKYPELFASGAPGGPGYATEKQISLSEGVEFDSRNRNPERYEFGIGNDAFSLAKKYAEGNSPRLDIAIWVGTKGFNYDATMDYMSFLDSLEIEYKVYSVGGVGHNPDALYQRIGIELMNFHSDAFELAN